MTARNILPPTRLLESARYVVLSPVRARMVRQVGNWPCSSYRATVETDAAPDWLERRFILSSFADSKTKAVERYIRFVADGKGQPSPWEPLTSQGFLGSDAFVGAMQRKVPRGRDLREVPQAQARPVAKPISVCDRQYADRDNAIAAAYAGGGHTMQIIGDYFGLNYFRISNFVRNAEQTKGKAWRLCSRPARWSRRTARIRRSAVISGL